MCSGSCWGAVSLVCSEVPCEVTFPPSWWAFDWLAEGEKNIGCHRTRR